MTNEEVFNIENKLKDLVNIIKKLESANGTNGGEEYYAIPSLLENVKFDLANTVSKHPVYECFLKHVKGIDLITAGYILGSINFSKVENIWQIFSYCGIINTNRKHNVFLYKKLLNASKYMINKYSPYAIYYYQNLKICNFKTEDKNNSDFIYKSKISMISMLLCDIYEVYNRIILQKENDSINYMDKTRLFDYRDYVFDSSEVDIFQTSKCLKKIKRIEKRMDKRIHNIE